MTGWPIRWLGSSMWRAAFSDGRSTSTPTITRATLILDKQTSP